jgi:hypothetical protein
MLRVKLPALKGAGFPVRWFLYTVRLAPGLKVGGKAHIPVTQTNKVSPFAYSPPLSSIVYPFLPRKIQQ